MPGFRRRFLISPTADRVTAAVEDDFHCMAVTLHHDGHQIAAVDAEMQRWPWTTCPGAVTVVRSTFVGAALSQAAALGLKSSNCTHLYDLAILAAAHAQDHEAVCYDVFVGDAVEGRKYAEIRRDGEIMLCWTMDRDVLRSPPIVQGTPLMKLRDWIATLDPAAQEAARILQWASLISHGRSIPLDQQSDATRMPPNCYSFQPERAKRAGRIGQILDFSGKDRRPLDHFDGHAFIGR
nr:DUF2889 domain-containing protein [Sphingobium boeckii]